MNLLDFPHFGWGKHINACIKKLLARVHGGILWMDRSVPITVDLIATITGLPTDGENPEQYLEDKTRAKAISDEIKAKYGMEHSNRGIRINDINDPATRFSTRLLGCKLMCKCHKEEVSVGVVIVTMQCAKGSSMSWAPYLLNSFLEDCKDTQDWGSEFHYSWLLILIGLIGWKEPVYSKYLERPGKCGTTRYISLRSSADPKRKKTNTDIFVRYFTEIQDLIADTWHISPETVQEFGQVANFRETRHSLWLQEKRDKAKEWLQLNYCVMTEEIQREVQEWPKEWKVPVIPTTVPSPQTQTQGRPAPTHQIGTNGARTKKRSMQGQEGGSTPAKKKPRTHNKPPRGPTQAPPCTKQPPTHSMEEVHAEETGTGTQEIPEEEEPGTGTQEIPEAEETGPTTAEILRCPLFLSHQTPKRSGQGRKLVVAERRRRPTNHSAIYH
jgi:hypothetical protein